jgi:glycosyltransferase involved in cell wall biosynthesis
MNEGAMDKLISLIVCTVGRPALLERLLRSLMTQTDGGFELIVVDQSGSDEIDACLRTYSVGQRVHYLRSGRGLSHGRNIGLRHAQGHVVGFPDDDCWYGEHVIARVGRFFQDPGNGILTGRTVDRNGCTSVSDHREESGPIDRSNVFESGNSNSVFALAALARQIEGFDETLGVGAPTPFQSGEETDFLLRSLRQGYRLYYDRDFVVYHDQSESSLAAQSARVRAYSQGYGRVLRLHHYGIAYLGMRVGRAAVRGAICLASGDKHGARQRYDWVNGSLRGFLANTRG